MKTDQYYPTKRNIHDYFQFSLIALYFLFSCAGSQKDVKRPAPNEMKNVSDSLTKKIAEFKKTWPTTIPQYPDFKKNCYIGKKVLLQDNLTEVLFTQKPNCSDSFNLGDFIELNSTTILKVNSIIQTNLPGYDTNKVSVFPKLTRNQIAYCLDTAYIRQYCGRAVNNDTLVFVNSFHKGMIKEFPNWQSEFIAFWQSTVNISKARIEFFEVNAPE